MVPAMMEEKNSVVSWKLSFQSRWDKVQKLKSSKHKILETIYSQMMTRFGSGEDTFTTNMRSSVSQDLTY
jgi:hypothetical protein